MSTLTRKLLRDIRRSRWQFVAVIAMIVLGVTFFGGVLSSYRNLQLSVDTPYRELRFADLTIGIQDAPDNVTGTVASVLGVRQVTGRISLELPSMPSDSSETFVGRIVTLPAPSRPQVNDVLVRAGSYFTAANRSEVLVEEAFARHHGFEVGDTVHLVTPFGPRNFTIVGIVISPEYLWPARTAWDHMPDVLRRWGVFFSPYASFSSALGLTGRINEVALTLADGANFDAVVAEVRRVLSPYGITSLVSREKQASNLVINLSVKALNSLSFIFPVFFLTIVALATYVLLTRLVHVQKHQIGVLLALGMSRRAILVHYLEFALLIGLGGSLVGSLGGYLLSGPITQLFAERVSLPLVYREVHWDVILWGVLLALAFTTIAAIVPSFRAAGIMPAETMRGESPRKGGRKWKSGPDRTAQESIRHNPGTGFSRAAKIVVLIQSTIIVFLAFWMFQEYRFNPYLQDYVKTYIVSNSLALTIFGTLGFSLTAIGILYGIRNTRTRLERASQLKPGKSRLPTTVKLPFRNLGRTPVRTGFTLISLALAASLIIVPLGFIDSMNYLVETSTRSSAYDLQALFYVPQSENISNDLSNWHGITKVEPFILLPTFLETPEKNLDIQLYGLRGDSDLLRLFTPQNVRVFPLQGEIFLSTVFERNGVRSGETVRLGNLSFTVADFVSGFSNSGFVRLADAQRIIGSPGMANGVLLRTDGAEAEGPLQTRLFSSFPVWSTLSTEKALQDTNDMLRLYYSFVDVIVVSGLLIASAIVFNFIMINVLERGREIASMRIIGVGGRAITFMLTVENLAVLVAAVAFGSVTGLFLTGYFVTLFQTDLFVLTARVKVGTYIVTGLLLIFVLLLSQIPAIRTMYHMDLARTTKERVS